MSALQPKKVAFVELRHVESPIHHERLGLPGEAPQGQEGHLEGQTLEKEREGDSEANEQEGVHCPAKSKAVEGEPSSQRGLPMGPEIECPQVSFQETDDQEVTDDQNISRQVSSELLGEFF